MRPDPWQCLREMVMEDITNSETPNKPFISLLHESEHGMVEEPYYNVQLGMDDLVAYGLI